MILALAALSFLAPAGTWYVDASAVSPGLGTPAQPYTRIDYALAQAGTLDGDVILVAPGDYVDESIDYLGKLVVVESTGDATDTWISGLGAGTANPHALVSMTQGENSLAVLRGFTLRDCAGRVGGQGGALYCIDSSPTIEQCRFENNLGGVQGSAVYSDGGAPNFVNCWFGGNGGDGPVFGDSSSLRFQGCFFADSAAAPRGNVRLVGGSMLASDCFFDGNGAGNGNPGAAMHVMAVGSQLNLLRCHWRSDLGSNPSGRGLYLEDCVTIVDDSTLTDMHPTDVPGGGLLAVGGDLTLTSTVFTGCATGQGVGGAMALVGCRATLTLCEFQGNSSAALEMSGGAIYKWGSDRLLVSDCLFEGNQAGEGGAIHVAFGPAAILGSFFLDNVATTQLNMSLPARGGAIVGLGPILVEHCAFVGNHSLADTSGAVAGEALGGAIYLGQAGSVDESLFHGNLASGQTLALGGAIYVDPAGASSSLTGLQLRHNLAQSRGTGTAQGGALAGDFNASHSSFVGNQAASGGGSTFGGMLDHCILSGGVPDDVAGMAQVTFSLISAGYPGMGNLSGDPLYWGSDDLHLLPGSPCIDSGDPLAPLDADGTPADMGALPFEVEHCGPGCSGIISTHPCISRPNSSGFVGQTRALGSGAVQDNLVILFSEDLPIGAPGYYLMAPQAGFTPFFGGSGGILCLGAGLVRLNSDLLFANAAGRVSRTLDLNQLPQGQTVMPGSSWFYQLWFRDMVGGQSTSNTTSSARIDFR